MPEPGLGEGHRLGAVGPIFAAAGCLGAGGCLGVAGRLAAPAGRQGFEPGVGAGGHLQVLGGGCLAPPGGRGGRGGEAVELARPHGALIAQLTLAIDFELAIQGQSRAAPGHLGKVVWFTQPYLGGYRGLGAADDGVAAAGAGHAGAGSAGVEAAPALAIELAVD